MILSNYHTYVYLIFQTGAEFVSDTLSATVRCVLSLFFLSKSYQGLIAKCITNETVVATMN